MIEDLRSTLHRVPLPRPWGPDVPANHLVVSELTLTDGRRGTGFSWTPAIGAHALHAMLEHDVRDAVRGLPAHLEAVWDRLWRYLHEAGGGAATMAMAAVDLAPWYLRATTAGAGLVDAIGRRRDRVPVYGSGVNLHYPLDDLVAQARRWRAAGVAGVKIKVGRPDLAEDVARVAAVREAIGPDMPLMIDANQRWDLAAARHAVTALAPFDLHWLEEPLPADDVRGHARLREAVPVPIALGENLRTIHRFRDFLVAGACDIVQPNVVRVGGITPFLRIAELARTFSVPVAPHLLPDISGQLACALPFPAMAEDVEDASFAALGLLDEPHPVRIGDGEAVPGDHLGHGLRFSAARLEETRIA